MKTLDCTVHTSFDEIRPFQEEWDRFVLEYTGDLYQSFDWCRIWWKYYGKGRELVIVVFRSGGRVTGILPFGIDPIPLGPFRIRVAKLINSEFTACVVAPAVAEDHADEILRSTLHLLFSEHRVEALSFGPFSERFLHSDPILSQVAAADPPIRLEKDLTLDDHIVFDLPADFDSHIASLKKSRRTDLRRTLRRIEESFGTIEVRNLWTLEEILEEFPAFRGMHDRYWHGRGQGGHFVDLVEGENFNLDLVGTFAPRGAVLLQKISAGDEVIGYQYGFRFGDLLHWRLTARPVGEEWTRLGVGVIGLYFLIREAISIGIRTLEAGPGRYNYKAALGGEPRPMRTLLIVRDSTLVSLKMKLIRLLYQMLDVAYYKIWYQRVVKRLGISRGAIWQYYLRCRL